MVCLGNICRSPSAEAILRHQAQELGLDIEVDSAGTAGYHTGERSDPRSIHHAEKRGYQMTHLARQITQADFKKFDHILVMDQSNFTNVSKIAPKELAHKVELISHYDPKKEITHIPDPYYEGPEEFEKVLDYLEVCVAGFLKQALPKE